MTRCRPGPAGYAIRVKDGLRADCHVLSAIDVGIETITSGERLGGTPFRNPEPYREYPRPVRIDGSCLLPVA